MARDLDGVLHGLGARGEEGGLGRAGDGRQRIDALGQRNRAFVGNDLEGRVREALQLLLHGLDHARMAVADRKSTRLNSSHLVISYAVFCLKKKKATPAIVPLCTRALPRCGCIHPSIRSTCIRSTPTS